MTGNTQTATVSKVDFSHRFTGVITYGSGKEVYLDTFYKTEKAARNAVIRSRARLQAAGITVKCIRTAVLAIHVTGCSSPIRRGIYPTDFSRDKDKWIEEYLK